MSQAQVESTPGYSELNWADDLTTRNIGGETVEVRHSRAQGFEYLGCRGSIDLLYFNDMLAAAQFYPEDFTDFLPRFRKAVGQPDLSNGDHFAEEGIQVWLFDYRGDQRVVWRDIALGSRFAPAD